MKKQEVSKALSTKLYLLQLQVDAMKEKDIIQKKIEDIRDLGYDCIVISSFVFDSINFFDEESKYKFYGIHNMLNAIKGKKIKKEENDE